MNVKKQILRSALVVSTALGLGAGTAAGEVSDGGGRARPLAVLDGGAVFVDLGEGEALALTLERLADPQGIRPPREVLRLAGGTPGHVGAIVLSDSSGDGCGVLADDSAVIPGVFDPDGTILVELPRRTVTVYAQGLEVTRADRVRSGIRELPPAGESVPAPILAAVRGALGEAPVSLRFFGAARLAGLQRSVDAAIVLGPDPARDGYVLSLSAALAQRTALVDRTVDGGVRLRFRDVEALAAAVEAVLVLDAFADLGETYEPLEVQGPLPGTVVGNGGDVVVNLPQDGVLVPTFDTVSRLAPPQRAGDKHPLPKRKDTAARHAGVIEDGGDVVVDLPPAGAGGFDVFFDPISTLAPPQRAGDKHPLPSGKQSVARHGGAVDDGGDVVVDLPDDGDGIVVTFDPVSSLAPGQRAGDKQPFPDPSGFHAGRGTSRSLESALRTLDLLRDRLRGAAGDGI